MPANKSTNQIVIYGGGMAGALLAKALSSEFQVTLVDPNEYFEVPMSVPRSLVKPSFSDRSMIPFSEALPRVSHIRGKLIEMRSNSALIERMDGKQEEIRSKISVLATGSSFSNELMRAVDGSSIQERKTFYREYKRRIEESDNILIVGGGPIGVEVAGEIIENFPKKNIIILEAGTRILSGTSETAAEHAAKVLKSKGVKIFTGERLELTANTKKDAMTSGGQAATSLGRKLPYDLLIWCIGGRPNTDYMKAHLSSELNNESRIRVTPKLRVIGHQALFALGDITDLDENKMAWHIDGQVKTAAYNIRQMLSTNEISGLKDYKPKTGNPMMAVTLGSRNGVLHLPVLGVIRSPCLSRVAKASHMLVPKYRKALGVKP